MMNGELEALVSAQSGARETKRILECIAKDVYAQPRHYGFKDEDEVGEAFCVYWPRICGLVERYADRGASFSAYLTSSLRYLALSMRRDRAKLYYRESAYIADSPSTEPGGEGEQAQALRPGLLIGAVKSTRKLCAYKERLRYLCVKCAASFSEQQLCAMAKSLDSDSASLMHAYERLRICMQQREAYQNAKRSSRNAAWLRMGANQLRLRGEYDPERRRYLQERIDRDRRIYTRAIYALNRVRRQGSNLFVAKLLGVPKGTVDAGLYKLMRQASPLYAAARPRYNEARRKHDPSLSEQQCT
jgi:hypothetical protein